MSDNKPEILNRRQVAARIGVSPATLLAWEAGGRSVPSPIFRCGGKTLYDGRQVDRWLKRHREQEVAAK